MSIDSIKKLIRDIPDFPKEGIIFKDIAPVLADPVALKESIKVIADESRDKGITKVAAIDARGFIFGSGVAMELGCGFVPVRKKGKLPYKTVEETYDLEYGTATIAMHIDAVGENDRVLIVDDLLATGGTAAAAAALVEKLKAEIVQISFLIELGFLKGREKLGKHSVYSAIVY